MAIASDLVQFAIKKSSSCLVQSGNGAINKGSENYRMRNKREYIIGVFEEAVACVLKGKKTFNDAENFWLDLYLTKPKAFQTILAVKEKEILLVAESVEKKMRIGNL